MKRDEILNQALHLVRPISVDERGKYARVWLAVDGLSAWGVADVREYELRIAELLSSDPVVVKRFNHQKLVRHVENEILHRVKLGDKFSINDANSIFNSFHEVKPRNVYVVAPISGLRIGLEKDTFKLSIFEFGSLDKLQIPISNTDGYYIKVPVSDSYDDLVSIDKAASAIGDFSRLIIFMSGRVDGSILLKAGLPMFASINHEQMYVDTSSYQVIGDSEAFGSSSISNRYLEKIPVDDPFFVKNNNYQCIWDLFEKKVSGESMTDMQRRIINSALAVGESSKMENVRNSIIYTCIALEILFSFDEGSIFQKSIADRLADTFAFLVAKDKESRLEIARLLKKVYRMRSALVHGGDKELSGDYITINVFLRAAISELLNNPKYKDVKKIDHLYEMVRDAQYSY